MKGKAILVVLVGMCVLLTTGCGKEESSSSSKVVKKSQKSEKAATPKDALENMADAIRKGDKDAFIACFDASDDQKKVMGAMCEMMAVMMKFEDAMKKAYGEDAVKKSGSKGILAELKDDKWLEGITIKIDGDKATATKEGEKEPLHLVKKDGGWKISAGDMLSAIQMKDTGKALKVYGAMTKVIKDATGKVGKKDYTAEKIDKEKSEEMHKAIKAIMETAGSP